MVRAVKRFSSSQASELNFSGSARMLQIASRDAEIVRARAGSLSCRSESTLRISMLYGCLSESMLVLRPLW